MEPGATDATVGPHPYSPNRTHDQNLGPRQPEATPAIPVKDPGWGLDSAEAVLRLRALRGNGDLDDYLGYHFQQEKHRNHDSRYQQACDLAA